MDEKTTDIYLDLAGNRIDENGNRLDIPLTKDQIDRILIGLKQKEIDEQIRSDKVIESILKDISKSADRIAGDIAEAVIAFWQS